MDMIWIDQSSQSNVGVVYSRGHDQFVCIMRLEHVLFLGVKFEFGLNHVTPRVRSIFSKDFLKYNRDNDPTWSKLKQRSKPLLEGRFSTSKPFSNLDVELLPLKICNFITFQAVWLIGNLSNSLSLPLPLKALCNGFLYLASRSLDMRESTCYELTLMSGRKRPRG